jgi:hypothetical protein
MEDSLGTCASGVPAQASRTIASASAAEGHRASASRAWLRIPEQPPQVQEHS